MLPGMGSVPLESLPALFSCLFGWSYRDFFLKSPLSAVSPRRCMGAHVELPCFQKPLLRRGSAEPRRGKIPPWMNSSSLKRSPLSLNYTRFILNYRQAGSSQTTPKCAATRAMCWTSSGTPSSRTSSRPALRTPR